MKELKEPEPIVSPSVLPGVSLEEDRWKFELSSLLRYLSILVVVAINKIKKDER